ncbi:MAG: YraN family protein [Gammaproteobacteria bacterium]|nr:YraN family protein [Gammaproteobacteria bacterium]
MKTQAPTQKQQAGSQAENLARRYLEQRGFEFHCSNYLCKTGEIDLIMQDGEMLVFVEVRFRADTRLGSPLETITAAKQRKLIRAAQFFLQQTCGNRWPACRFDVVGISGDLNDSPRIDWIANAFGA